MDMDGEEEHRGRGLTVSAPNAASEALVRETRASTMLSRAPQHEDPDV